jgi:phage shock protein PspC (stress-responsive transcriptional regulator)
MKNRKLFWLRIIVIAAVVIIDLSVYIFLGLLMMGYDDTYNSSKGEYWSWESMTKPEKTIVVLMQFWNAFNIALVIYILWRLFRRYKNKITSGS